MSKEELERSGYKLYDLYYTDGVTLIIEVLGKWYQTHINPYSLQTSQVEIKSIKDIQTPLNYDPIVVRVPNTPKKKKSGKQLLPSYIIKVSDKWYKNNDTGKYMKPEWVESKYIIPK